MSQNGERMPNSFRIVWRKRSGLSVVVLVGTGAERLRIREAAVGSVQRRASWQSARDRSRSGAVPHGRFRHSPH